MKAYEAYAGEELVATGRIEIIAKVLGLSVSRARSIADKEHSKYRVIEIGTTQQVYAYYIDDEFITEGSMQQIAEETGELMVNLRFMSSNAAKQRNLKKTLIKLEGETVIVKRTHKERFAPIPSRDEQREQIKVFKNVPAKKSEWKPSGYVRDLFEHTTRHLRKDA